MEMYLVSLRYDDKELKILGVLLIKAVLKC